jgi:hypothetical protein
LPGMFIHLLNLYQSQLLISKYVKVFKFEYRILKSETNAKFEIRKIKFWYDICN